MVGWGGEQGVAGGHGDIPVGLARHENLGGTIPGQIYLASLSLVTERFTGWVHGRIKASDYDPSYFQLEVIILLASYWTF